MGVSGLSSDGYRLPDVVVHLVSVLISQNPVSKKQSSEIVSKDKFSIIFVIFVKHNA